MEKKLLSALLLAMLIALALIIFISGCSNPIPSQVPMPGGPTAEGPMHPPAAAALSEEAQKAQEEAHKALDDPTATLEDLMGGLERSKQYGFNNMPGKEWGYEGTIEQEFLKRIGAKLMEEMMNPKMCKKRLNEIAQLAQILNIPEVEKFANSQISGAQTNCQEAGESVLERTYSYAPPESEINSDVKITVSMQGTLKEYTPMGLSDNNLKTYVFEDGTFSWTYDEQYTGECGKVTRRGSGTAELKEAIGGSITINKGGNYQGYFSKEVILDVAGVCEDYGAENLQALANQGIEFSFAGTMADYSASITPGQKSEIVLVGSSEENENQVEGEYDKKVWNIKLPR